MDNQQKLVKSVANGLVSFQQDNTPKTVAHSPLFKLPPELRCMIYHFALVSDTVNPVLITESGGIPEPGLLSVNKLLRSETFAIYYQENHFRFIVSHYNDAAIRLAVGKANSTFSPCSFDLTDGTWQVAVQTHQRNWKNLVSWLRACQQSVSGGLSRSGSDKKEEKLIEALFAVVYNKPEVTPRALDAVLEAMRPALVAHHADWDKD